MSRLLHTRRLGLSARGNVNFKKGQWIKKFICVTCLVCVFGVGTAYAEEVKTRQYFTVKGGVDKYHDFETGLAIMGSWGSYLTESLRVETEVSYRTSSVSGSAYIPLLGLTSGEVTLSNVGAMLNGVYELDIHPNLRPYVIGGVGGSLYLWELDFQTRYGGGSLDGSEFAFAYQGGGGLRYVINAAWALEVEYRFFGTPDVGLQVRQGSRTVTAAEIPNEHSSFLVGLSYQF